MEKVTAAKIPYRVGEWLPSDDAFLAGWLEAMILTTTPNPGRCTRS